MGKPTGFMEIQRSEAAHRPAKERTADYAEFTLPQNEETLRAQAARCMDCGVPFCHSGFVVEGLSIGCPLCNLVPEINDLVYHGDIPAAYERLAKTHPFPEITGRLCPALCEGSCTLGEHEQPVTVKNIERYVADEMLRRGLVQPRKPAGRTGRRVAVVGSGPAGLAAADVLNRYGHEVTVFERADRPGGLLMYGIPNMKLDKDIVLGRVRLLEAEGVRFEMNAEIGGGYPVLRLVQEYDAMVLCGGAGAERRLAVPGAESTGVHTAMQYLRGNTKSLLDSNHTDGAFLSAKGKHVLVVGGGDTGTDCVGTAIRQGAKSVVQLEILPKPPAQRAENNPWPLWPKVLKTDYGQWEAKAHFGADPREWCTTVKEIRADARGNVCGVLTVEVAWEEQNGRLTPVELPGTERLREVDFIVTAMGFTGPEQTLIEQLGLDTDARGNIQTPQNSYKTSLTGVFAAGDMRRGPSLVVWAIDEGRRAAEQCNRALMRR